MGRGQQFSKAFKREAVRKAEASQNAARTARELGISSKTLYEGLKTFGQAQSLDMSTATMSELSARIRQLERAGAEKDSQIEVLKKAISIVSQTKGSDLL